MGEPEDDRTFGEATGGEPAQAWSATGRPDDPQPIAGNQPPAGYAGGSWQPDPAADQRSTDPGSADPDGTVVIDGSWSASPRPAAAADQDVPPGNDPGTRRPEPGAAAAVPVGGEPPDSVPDGPPKALKKGRRRAGRDKTGKVRPEPVIPPGPVLVAAGLGLLTPAGWVFKDIELTLRPSSVAAIVGPAGTGRSCLLLALTGRMAANTGTLTVAGHSVKDEPSTVRALTAVARIGSTIAPEPSLTVQQSINERCLADDVDARIGRARFDEACAAMRLKFEPTALVGSMVGDQATLLAVALACVRVSALIVLDDLDRGVSTAVQQTMLDALLRLAKTGPTIVLSTTDRIPVMGADVVLDLTPSEGAAMWLLDAAATDRPELDQARDDDRVWPQLESGFGPDERVDSADEQSGDPHARWKPGYPGDTEGIDQGDPNYRGDPNDRGDAGYHGEPNYQADPNYPDPIYSADPNYSDPNYPDDPGYPGAGYQAGADQAGRAGYPGRAEAADRFLDPSRPDDSNQRDAPTEDSR